MSEPSESSEPGVRGGLATACKTLDTVGWGARATERVYLRRCGEGLDSETTRHTTISFIEDDDE